MKQNLNLQFWAAIAAIVGAIVAVVSLYLQVVKLRSEIVKLNNEIIVYESDKERLSSELAQYRSDYRNLVISMITKGKIEINDVQKFLPATEVKTVESIVDETDVSVNISLAAGWKPQGPGNVGGGFKDGKLIIQADLKKPDDYCELFLDLRSLRLEGLERNEDGTYNLAGREIIATVTADKSFIGDQKHPNGVQFLIKDSKWDNIIGTWLNVNDSILSSDGMTVFYRIPKNTISQKVAGISLKFTINSESKDKFKGTFRVNEVMINK